MIKSVLAASVISPAAATSAFASPATPATAAAAVAADRGMLLEVQHLRGTSERHARSRDRYQSVSPRPQVRSGSARLAPVCGASV